MVNDHVARLQELQPYLNVLKDGSTKERAKKKSALDKVKQLGFQETASWPVHEQTMLLETLLDSLVLWSTQSEIEYIREKTVMLLQCYVTRIEQPKAKVVIETCLQRFPSEETEEIRQGWIQVCVDVLNKKQPHMDEEDWFTLATLAVKDPCPEVIKQGASLVLDLARLYPKAVAYRGEQTIIHSVIPLLIHKHAAIRVLGIKAMYQVLLCSSQGMKALSDLLTKLVHDHTVQVRTTFFTSVGDLLIHWLPTDRYDHAGRLLPVLFAGLMDELTSIAETSRHQLDQLGKVCYQDLMDAGINTSSSSCSQVTVGLKHLVHQCYEASMKRLMDDSNDFIPNKKRTALAALDAFLSYVSSDDMIRSNKWVIQRWMIIMAGEQQHFIDKITCTIAHLITWPILLDQLLPRLSKPNLMAESSQLPANITVSVIWQIISMYHQAEPISDQDKQRIITSFRAPHVFPFLPSPDTLDSFFSI
ncbi:armadillo-type protein [Halteromyces radiatus]|uniref:armadillo-type protein n=1 Tax=Halteromyces radiatus TaxID=101107 RepID=UPI00221E6E7C|nr:armadillo-type protein [Halteromyces radiatus]KAI8093846.1 armadillo-type protein [Halteromyces radiatus]